MSDVRSLLAAPEELEELVSSVFASGCGSSQLLQEWSKDETCPLILAALEGDRLGKRSVAFCLQVLTQIVLESSDQKELVRRSFRNLFFQRSLLYVEDRLVLTSFSKLFAVVFNKFREEAGSLLDAWFLSDYQHRIVSLHLATRLIEYSKSGFGLETMSTYILNDIASANLDLDLLELEIDMLSVCFECNATSKFVEIAMKSGALQIPKIFEKLAGAPNSFKRKVFGVLKEIAELLFFYHDTEALKQFILESLSVMYAFLQDSTTSDQMVQVISSFWTSLSNLRVLRDMEIPSDFTELIKDLTTKSLTQEKIVTQPVTVENFVRGWVNLRTPILNENMISVLLEEGPLQPKVIAELAKETSVILEEMGKAFSFDYPGSAAILCGFLASNDANIGLACLISACASMIATHQRVTPVDPFLEHDLALAQQIAANVKSRNLPSLDFGIPTMLSPNGFFEMSVCEFCDAIRTAYSSSSRCAVFGESMLVFYTRMLMLFRCQMLVVPLMRHFFSSLDVSKMPYCLKEILKNDEGFRSFFFDLSHPFLSDEGFIDEATAWIENIISFASLVPFEVGLQVILENALELQNEFLVIEVLRHACKSPTPQLLFLMEAKGTLPILKEAITGHRYIFNICDIIERLAGFSSFPTLSRDAMTWANLVMGMIDSLLQEHRLAEPETEESMTMWIARAIKKLVENPMLNISVMSIMGNTYFCGLFNRMFSLISEDDFLQKNPNVFTAVFDLLSSVLERFDNVSWIEMSSIATILKLFQNGLQLYPTSRGVTSACNCVKLMFDPFRLFERVQEADPGLIRRVCFALICYRFLTESPSYPPAVPFIVVEFVRLETDLFVSLLSNLDEAAMEGCAGVFEAIFNRCEPLEYHEIMTRIKRPMEAIATSAMFSSDDEAC